MRAAALLVCLACGLARAQMPGHGHHDNDIHGLLLLDRLEAWREEGSTGLGWEGTGWLGTDLDRLWLRTDGEHHDGRVESARAELLYGRSISAWWDLVGGIAHEFRPGSGRTFVAIGVQGLAPQRFEIEATAYVGEGGQTAARFEAGYRLLLTNRLILQPLLELRLYGKDDAGRGIGSGFSTMEGGLRLRHEFTRRFAPYVGVTYERAFGRTADLRRAGGAPAGDARVVLGLRSWF